jgi:hypothetical protein
MAIRVVLRAKGAISLRTHAPTTSKSLTSPETAPQQIQSRSANSMEDSHDYLAYPYLPVHCHGPWPLPRWRGSP